MAQAKYYIVPAGKQYKLPYNIPFYAQFSSPELVLEIIRGRIKAEDDPRWLEFGAESKELYSYWSWRSCGIASLKMAVEALGGPKRRMMDWIEHALSIGGFLDQDKVGRGKPSGWVHRALLELARSSGLDGECIAPAETFDIINRVDRGRMVIASVSHELGEKGPITKDRGHLVLLHGYSKLDDAPEAILLNNPSGRYPELRENCWLPVDRFSEGSSGRIITIFEP